MNEVEEALFLLTHEEHKEYYKNGQLRTYDSIKNGVLDGECKEWYENGQLSICFHFQDGKQNGDFKMWDEYGKLTNHCW